MTTPGSPAASEVRDEPTSSEELTLVDNLLANYDEPSAEDLIAEQSLAEPAPPVQPTPEPVAPAFSPVQVQPAPTTPLVPPAPVAQPVAPVAPAAVPAVAPAATPPATPAVAAPGTAPAATPPAVVAPASPAAPAVAPGQELNALRQGMEAQREQIVTQLAQSYEPTFTDEDLEHLQSTEPGQAKKTLAKMAARLHVDVAQNIMGMVASQLPVMINRMSSVQAENDRATDVFYTEYPDLKPHDAIVKKMAQTLRAQFPQMPRDQFIPMVVSWARTQVGSAQPAGVPPVQTPAVVPPNAMVRQVPFAPAAPGGGGTAPAKPQVGQQWAFMTDILKAEDSGAFETR